MPQFTYFTIVRGQIVQMTALSRDVEIGISGYPVILDKHTGLCLACEVSDDTVLLDQIFDKLDTMSVEDVDEFVQNSEFDHYMVHRFVEYVVCFRRVDLMEWVLHSPTFRNVVAFTFCVPPHMYNSHDPDPNVMQPFIRDVVLTGRVLALVADQLLDVRDHHVHQEAEVKIMQCVLHILQMIYRFGPFTSIEVDWLIGKSEDSHGSRGYKAQFLCSTRPRDLLADTINKLIPEL
jgi:hypothetical protein